MTDYSSSTDLRRPAATRSLSSRDTRLGLGLGLSRSYACLLARVTAGSYTQLLAKLLTSFAFLINALSPLPIQLKKALRLRGRFALSIFEKSNRPSNDVEFRSKSPYKSLENLSFLPARCARGGHFAPSRLRLSSKVPSRRSKAVRIATRQRDRQQRKNTNAETTGRGTEADEADNYKEINCNSSVLVAVGQRSQGS